MSVTSTIVPPQNDDAITQGVCDDLDPHLVLYLIGALLTFSLAWYCRHRSVCPPTFTAGRSTPDFGHPFGLATVVYNVCLWFLIPQALLFVVFHIITTDLFPLQTHCACIVVATVPALVLLLLVQGAPMLIFLFRPNAIRRDIGNVLVPEIAPPAVGYREEDVTLTLVESFASPNRRQDVVMGYPTTPTAANFPTYTPRVLLIGCVSHGALLIDALDKERRGVSNVEVHMVDCTDNHHGGHEQAYVQYNASCIGVSDMLATRFHSSLCYDGSRFVLPFPNGSFDQVIVSPGLRNSAAVGDFFTSEDTKSTHMRSILREAMRVLREDGSGGVLSAYDDGSNVVKLWADLRDSGFSSSITDAYATWEPIFKMKSKMYRLHCPSSSSQHHQVRSALQRLPATSMAAASTTANIKHFELKIMTNVKPGHNGESVLDASAQPSTPLVISPPLQTYAESVGHHNAPGGFFTCFVVLLEVAVFVALVLVAMALYETLSIPSTIDFDVRLGNIVAIAAVTYPVFAYAARSATLSVHRARSVAQCLGAEAAAVLATLVYCGIQSLPAFVLQIALKDTSLGESASTIGMIVTVLLGMTISNTVPRIRRAKLISDRKIPEEYIAAFL